MNKIEKECFIEVKNWIDYLSNESDFSYGDFGFYITIKDAMDSIPSSNPNKERLTEYVNSLTVEDYDHLTDRFAKRFHIMEQRIYKDLDKSIQSVPNSATKIGKLGIDETAKDFDISSAQSVYIPTPFIVPPKIEVGENWFVKLPGCSMIQNVRIVDITEKTVNLKDLHSENLALGRYKKTDVEFIEKVE